MRTEQLIDLLSTNVEPVDQSVLRTTLAWAVGDAMSDGTTDHPLIERWDGSTWTAVTDPAIVGLQGQLWGLTAPTPSTASGYFASRS